jgi:hypothetical protein
MYTYQVFVRVHGAERDLYVEAATAAEAIAKVRAALVGLERRWASVFV